MTPQSSFDKSTGNAKTASHVLQNVSSFSIMPKQMEMYSSPEKEPEQISDKVWTEEKLNPTWEDQDKYQQSPDINEQTYATMINEETIDSIHLDDKERDESAHQFSFYTGKSESIQGPKESDELYDQELTFYKDID